MLRIRIEREGVRVVSTGNRAICSSLEQVRQRSGSDFAALGLLDSSKRKLSWNYSAGSVSDRTLLVVQKSNVGLSGMAIRTGRLFKSAAVSNVSERYKLGEPLMLTEQLQIAVSVPLSAAEQILSVLLLGRRSIVSFSNEDLEQVCVRIRELTDLLIHENVI